MKFYKDYHFYIAISAFIILVVGIVTDYFNIFVNEEIVATIISYILSILIAFNIININVTKNKNSEEIKNDIDSMVNKIEENTNNLKKNKNKKTINSKKNNMENKK